VKIKVGIEYKIGGRTVSQQEWLNHLTESANEKARLTLQKRLAAVRCPEHGLAPEIIYSGNQAHIKGCCPQVIEAAQEALNR
jgi:hypothetical protein